MEGDIIDPSSLAPLIESVDYIFHLAGVIRGYNQQEYDRINLIGTQNIIRMCCKVNPNIKRLVITSSMAATTPGTVDNPACEEESGPPHPGDFYGVSKRKIEYFARKHFDKLPISILRPCPVMGPGDLVSLQVYQMVKMGIKLGYPGKRRLNNFIDVEDLVQALYLSSINDNAIGEVFNIAGDGLITMEELQEMIGYYTFNKKYGSLLTLQIPNFLFHGIAFVLEAMYRMFRLSAPFFNKSKAVNATAQSNVCSNEKAKQLLGWNPQHSYISMIKRAGNWFKQRGMI